MREVLLCGRKAAGRVTQVDDDDFETAIVHRWWVLESARVRHGPYAVMWQPGVGQVSMHRLLRPQWALVDHWDGNGLNNQGVNLREATIAQNGANRRKQGSPSSSQFKGVTWHKGRYLWQASIMVNGQARYLGAFADEGTAACAYDTAAREAFGEFARVNFP